MTIEGMRLKVKIFNVLGKLGLSSEWLFTTEESVLYRAFQSEREGYMTRRVVETIYNNVR